MQIQGVKVDLKEILAFRVLFLNENRFQFIHNKCHDYGWADTYLFMIDETRIGYGAVWGQQERNERDAIFEFYIIPSSRKYSNLIFTKFHSLSGATFIECQSNDLLLTSMLYEYAENINAESILFEDCFQTNLDLTGITCHKAPKETGNSSDSGEYLLEKNGDLVATGGFMLNYNEPYADIYYEVKEKFRGKGFGSLLIQELKKEIYLAKKVPSARCNIHNPASKANLLKAGFMICGFIIKGHVIGTQK